MNDFDLPAARGSYVLRLHLPQAIHLRVGRLGVYDFSAADYLYLGSANGPGGIRARLMHHFRPVTRPHWHLDWLRVHTQLAAGWYSTNPGRLECIWSQAIYALPGVQVPAPGFGATDCQSGCPAHLMFLPAGIDNLLIAHHLGQEGGRAGLRQFSPLCDCPVEGID